MSWSRGRLDWMVLGKVWKLCSSCYHKVCLVPSRH
jgi:hypothetical protein